MFGVSNFEKDEFNNYIRYVNVTVTLSYHTLRVPMTQLGQLVTSVIGLISHEYKYFREDRIHYRDSDKYSPVHSTDVTASTCFHSWNFWCLCCVLEWPMSRTASSSRAEEASSYRKPAFNAQQSRVGDVCKVGKRIQSVFDTSHNIHLIPCTDSDIIHVHALGTSIIILNSYEAAVNLLDKRSGIYSSR